MFRVTVDGDVCENNGLCEGIAPELFRLSDDDAEPVQVLVHLVDDGLRGQAQTAARSWPQTGDSGRRGGGAHIERLRRWANTF